MSILTITYWTHVEQICQLIFKNEKKNAFYWKVLANEINLVYNQTLSDHFDTRLEN